MLTEINHELPRTLPSIWEPTYARIKPQLSYSVFSHAEGHLNTGIVDLARDQLYFPLVEQLEEDWPCVEGT